MLGRKKSLALKKAAYKKHELLKLLDKGRKNKEILSLKGLNWLW